MPSQEKSDKCLFCRIIRKEIPAHILYEDDEVIVFLDILPVNKGHSLVLPKKHAENLFEIDNRNLLAVFSKARDIAKIIVESVNAQGFNLLVNNRKAAGQLIDHVHLHIIPRFDNDGFEHWHGEKISEEEMKSIASKITSHLK